MGRKTLKLPEEAFEKHNERRKEMGLTWPEYIDQESDSLKDVLQGTTVELDATERKKIAEEVISQWREEQR